MKTTPTKTTPTRRQTRITIPIENGEKIKICLDPGTARRLRAQADSRGLDLISHIVMMMSDYINACEDELREIEEPRIVPFHPSRN